MPLSSKHVETLKNVSRFLVATEDPWWIVGSAGIALCGFDPETIRDIDVVISLEDARRLMSRHKLSNAADGGNHLFRSKVILRPDLGLVPVEIMSHYDINNAGTWTRLTPRTREIVELDGTTLFVPELDEQIEILNQLGRKKDLQRVAMIRSALGGEQKPGTI